MKAGIYGLFRLHPSASSFKCGTCHLDSWGDGGGRDAWDKPL